MFNWIKDKVVTFLSKFNKKKVLKVAEAIKILKDFEEKDIQAMSEEFFTNNNTKSASTDMVVGMYNNRTGKIVDMKALYKEVDVEYSNMKAAYEGTIKYIENEEYDKDDAFDISVRHSFSDNPIIRANDLEQAYDKGDVDKVSIYSNFDKLKKDELVKYADKIEEITKEAEKFFLTKHKELEKHIKDTEKAIKDGEKENQSDNERKKLSLFNKALSMLFLAVKIINVPIAVILTYARWLGYITKHAFEEQYITTDKMDQIAPLYHLSKDPDLAYLDADIMKPRTSKNSGWQFLPPRISFAPGVLECAFGVPAYFITPGWGNGEGGERETRDLYLYKGLPDDDTRYLKTGIVRHFVEEYDFTKEICVVTKIKIEKVGKVRITYDATVGWPDKRKFIGWEKIEE